MSKTISIAYSTCPNDTFIFYALAHKKIVTDILFEIQLEDVESLNQSAKSKKFDVSKLSFAAIGHLLETYGLLHCGAALGRGCGPMVVARPGFDLSRLKSIAVPGLWTTANMLLNLYLSEQPAGESSWRYDIASVPFDRIMPLVKNGRFDFGVIIHEGRFTYREYGLVSLLDLGAWWEKTSLAPIPLGGIAIRRDLPEETVKAVEKAIYDSILYALANRDETYDYIKKYSQEMSLSVIRQHIDLYVNDFTVNTGDEGKRAIHRLFNMARKYNMLPETDLSVFAS
ncbi:MAG TPA: 1,4-dihydroxy-6-naphthoate synthase [Desulfobacteraceae bacterium]|nr:1,4-dihydroxy-6-naphthoate synthase [Desulfobacteraceae bacterium]